MAVVSFERLRAKEVVDRHDVPVGPVDDAVVQPAGVPEGQGLGRARPAIPPCACTALPDRPRLPRDAATMGKMPRVGPDLPGFGDKEYEAKIFVYGGLARLGARGEEGHR